MIFFQVIESCPLNTTSFQSLIKKIYLPFCVCHVHTCVYMLGNMYRGQRTTSGVGPYLPPSTLSKTRSLVH